MPAPPPESLPVTWGMIVEEDRFEGSRWAGFLPEDKRRKEYDNICSLSYALVRALGLMKWVRQESIYLSLPLPPHLSDDEERAFQRRMEQVKLEPVRWRLSARGNRWTEIYNDEKRCRAILKPQGTAQRLMIFGDEDGPDEMMHSMAVPTAEAGEQEAVRWFREWCLQDEDEDEPVEIPHASILFNDDDD